MSSPGHTDPDPRSRKNKNSLLPILLVSILLGTALAGAWWYFAPQETPVGEPASEPSPTAVPTAQKGPATGQSPPAEKALTPGDRPEHPTPRERGDRINPRRPGETVAAPSSGDGADETNRHDCHHLATRLHGFFTHLDAQPYIQKSLAGRHAQEYFLGLAHKLLNQPPVVSRETDDLYTMLKNMAHFFRVIGGNNITLIKTILSRERDTIEDVIGDFHAWATGPRCEEPIFPFHPPLEKMYEYAGFFLNSLGGRSYLFRRDSRSRLLVNYYSILVVDLANDRGLNRHGIDLRPLIPLAIDEIENTTQLIYKEQYLDTLYRLEKKYPRLQSDMDSVPVLQ